MKFATDGTVEVARLVLGAVASRPPDRDDAAAPLAGKNLDDAVIARAGARAERPREASVRHRERPRIRIPENGRSLPEPYLDISGLVSGGGEQALRGLAFHRSFVNNGRFFVNSTDRDGDTRIVEFTVADPKANRAAVSGERELPRVDRRLRTTTAATS